MRYKLIVFDLDGTLFDTLHDIHLSLIYVLTKHGFEKLPSIEESKLFIGRGLTDFVMKGVTFSGGSAPIGIVDEFISHYAENCINTSVPYPNSVELLQKLFGNGYQLAVLSNKSERLVKLILDHFNVSCYFKFVAGGDTFVEKKPSPLPLLEISKIFETSDVLMVGDSHNDIDAGKAAKFDTVYCSYGYGKAINSTPTYSIDNILKLGDIVL